MTGVEGVVTPPESATGPKDSSGVQSLISTFNNLSVQIKASVASVLLLICLLALGTNAYLTSTRSAAGLQVLTNDLIPKQQAFSQISDAVVATHIKIFRYVSWASNGVSDVLLKPLYTEIDQDLDTLSDRIAALAQRPDLSSSGTRRHGGASGQVENLQKQREGHDRHRPNRRTHGDDDARPNGRRLSRPSTTISQICRQQFHTPQAIWALSSIPMPSGTRISSF